MELLSKKIEDRIYTAQEALNIVKENANAKFDETIEAHIRLGIDPKYTDQQLRTTVALPNGTGQSIKIAVITSGENVAKAKTAGADFKGLQTQSVVSYFCGKLFGRFRCRHK